MDNAIVVVNDEPYCVWEADLQQRSKEFLQGIDVDYFDYSLNVHLTADDEKRASIALRTTYHHALETLFSLLGAYIQAPNCAYAWMAKCANKDLRLVLSRITKNDPTLFSALNVEVISWESVAKLIFQSYLPGTDKGENTAKLFAKLWRRLAGEYLDSDHIDEYNSLKHGFRVHAGGFTLIAGVEHTYGVPPPSNEMKWVGGSDYGISFFRLETIGDKKDNRSLRSRRIALNWKIERVVGLIQLVSMSITNVASALKIANGFKAAECKYVRPTEDNDFDKPWSFSPGVTKLSLDFTISEEEVFPIAKRKLLERLKELRKR